MSDFEAANWSEQDVPVVSLFQHPEGDITPVAFSGMAGAPAAWLKQLTDRLLSFLRYPPGWDGYGGRPIDHSTAQFAAEILATCASVQAPAPSLVPLAYGGVQIEWHRCGWDIEIEIADPNEVYLFAAPQKGRSHHFQLGANISKLRPYLAKITG